MTLSLVLSDALAIALAFYAAFRLRLILPFPEKAAQGLRFLDFLPLLGLQIFAIVTAFFVGKMYHRRRIRYGSDELATIFSGVSMGMLISIAVASLTLKTSSGAYDYSRGMVVYSWLLTILFTMLFRGVQARLQRALQYLGFGRTRVVVVGSGDPAVAVLQRLMQTPRLGYDIVGLIPFDGARPVPGVPTLGTLEALPETLTREAVDEVIIALAGASDEDMLRIISRCDRSSLSIKVYPDLFQIMAGQMTMGELGGLPLLNIRDVALRGWRVTFKRAIDVIGSATFLILMSPILLIFALLIKLDSPGPVFFAQERMGLDGKKFWCIKFRSMRRDAEKLGTWTTKDDPRRTRLGTWMRAKNVDEFPQFINVLLGDMSLVGPRPEQPRYVEEFRTRIPRYMERHREKSGITGWAQVNGLRGDTSIEERTQYDLWYIENWSVGLDFRILFQTVFRMFAGKDANAY
ncbi:MAG: undecaprenyl-phosphate glucose phosphotransferase [Thermoflexales bacterium]|nr:undecaprenyl-phosphate glucose phosphotransferase [Thermoflexales bacterium]